MCASDAKSISWPVLTLFLIVFFLELLGTSSIMVYCLFFSMAHLFVLHHTRYDKGLRFFLIISFSSFHKIEFEVSLLGWQGFCLGLCEMPSDPFQEPVILVLWTTSSEKKFLPLTESMEPIVLTSYTHFPYVIITFRLDKVWKMSSVHLCPWGFQFLNLSL